MIYIRDWNTFQHYKDRNPPWIRLYARLLDDPELYELSDKAARILPLLWLIASRHSTDGSLPAIKTLAFQLRIDSNVLADLLKELNNWVIFDASDLLAPCLQHAIPEQSRAETEQRQSRAETRAITALSGEVKTIAEQKKKRNNKKSDSKSGPTWESYRNAYYQRYGTEPIRDAATNSNLCKLVDKVGADAAPSVAAYYLTSSDRWFVTKCHDTQTLIGNAQKLHTEWKTGNRVTSSQATEMDRQQGTGDVWHKILAENAEKERLKNGN